MGYVIKNTKDRDTTESGWHPSPVLGKKQIDAIRNLDEETGEQPPRSIPTPFAAIHNVREAMLRYVDGERGILVRSAISNALDVGMLLFTFEGRENELELLRFAWGKNLVDWLGRANLQRRLASAIELHRKQDGGQYRFSESDGLYLVTRRNQPSQVLGGTCPETMFFASPGKQTDLTRERQWYHIDVAGGDILFDNQYQLVHERHEDFALWLYRLYKQVTEQTGGAETAFAKYLKHTLKHDFGARPELRDEILSFVNGGEPDAYFETYRPVLTTGTQHAVRLYGSVDLRCEDNELDEARSDFQLFFSESKVPAKPPLALPYRRDGSTKQLLPGEVFNPEVHTPPFKDERPMAERAIPGTNKKYPYLTVDDLLAPYLFEVPYPIDATRWYRIPRRSGSGDTDRDFLLPLKPAFFDYFTAEDLRSANPRTPKIEVSEGPSFTKITLSLPLAAGLGNSVKFEREYMPTSQAPAEDGSRGAIGKLSFGLAMFPDHVDIKAPETIRLLLTKQQDGFSVPVSIEVLDTATGSGRGLDSGVDWSSNSIDATIYRPLSRFDAVAVTSGSHDSTGYLLPVRPALSGTKSYSFAVDFGTTNTHVEVREGKDGRMEALAFDPVEGITATLHPFAYSYAAAGSPREDIASVLQQNIPYQKFPEELLPTVIGEQRPIEFPIRTVSVEPRQGAVGTAVASQTVAIPWHYQRVQYSSDAVKLATNLKWDRSAGEVPEHRMRAFLGTLCLAMRAYVHTKQGDPAATRVVWFFPTSMSTGDQVELRQIWNEEFAKAFPEVTAADAVRSLPESIAPYEAYGKEGIVKGLNSAINVDIGGGTADVAVFYEGSVQRITSYRFAGNTVYGNGGETTKANGFVKAFEPKVREALEKIDKVELLPIHEELLRKDDAATDLINYWFSLATHPRVEGHAFDFAKMLGRDSKIRVAFVVYFAAMAYRLARDIESSPGIPAPSALTFSGNGSRMLRFLSKEDRQLERFFTIAYERALTTPPDEPIRLLFKHRSDNPKEVTAKGGLEFLSQEDDKKYEDWQNRLVRGALTEELRSDTAIERIFGEYQDFAKYFRELATAFDFDDKFGIKRSAVTRAADILDDDRTVRSYIKERRDLFVKEAGEDETIHSHEFFFPFYRMLPQVAREMA